MATMDDVAARAGVSGTTVSHVLNGTRHVSDETRAKVEAAIHELGYRHNTVARALAAGRSQTIGLSISALTNPYFGFLVHAIEKQVTEAGYMLISGDSHDDATMEKRVVDSFLDRRVDGIIMAPSVGAEYRTIPQIVKAQTPLILIDRNSPIDCDQITPENVESAYLLTRHLLEKGHRRIAVVTGLTGLGSTSERYQGYARALADFEIEVDESLVLIGASKSEVAQEAVVRRFREPHGRPTGLVVMNNSMSIGAIRGLRSLRLAIPDDVAFCGYDDFEWADLFEPQLTTVAQDVEEMGRRAVELLFRRIAHADTPTQRLQIPTTFKHRHSCGCTPSDAATQSASELTSTQGLPTA